VSIEYWVTCAKAPWPALEHDDAFGEIVAGLLEDGEYELERVTLSLEESRPSFVPSGSVVLHVSGPANASWDEVLELLEAMAAAGDGVVFSEDRQVVLDRRSVRPGMKAFKDRPEWAVALAAKWPGLHVVVSGQAVPDPAKELDRVGLSALAGRISITRIDGGLEIRGPETDVLVAGQVLAHAARGSARAIGPSGTTQELPS
jgi:hypothetical protein